MFFDLIRMTCEDFCILLIPAIPSISMGPGSRGPGSTKGPRGPKGGNSGGQSQEGASDVPGIKDFRDCWHLSY